ncbi:MAG: ATP-binding protein [Actinomycetota bacterium]|nr:ATP-binding protein [Actinomycetota bacterium]
MLGQVRSLFLLFCLLWSLIGVFGVKEDAGVGGRAATVAAIVIVELCLCWGYRRGRCPRALWLIEAPCVYVVAVASDFSITVGLLYVWINFRALYGGWLDQLIGASCVTAIMGCGVAFNGVAVSSAVPLTVTALIGLVINHTLARGIAARDRAALREQVVATAGAGFAAATDRRDAARVAAEAVVALDRRISAAVLATIAAGDLRPIGYAGDARPGTDGRAVNIAVSGPAHAPALRPGGYAQIAGAEAASFAEQLGLPPACRVDLVPLAADGRVFGLLVVTYDRRPRDDLSAPLSTLADEAALTLDQLLTRSRLNVVVEHSHDALLLCGEQGTIRYANPAAGRLLGVPGESLIARDLRSLIHPDDLAEVLAPDQKGAQIRRLRGPEPRSWIEFEVLVAYVTEHDGSRSLIFNARDISERQRLELELRHAQRLESVGRLAAGIAHEVNTPMQFIGDNVRFLDESLTDLLAVVTEVRRSLGDDTDLARRMVELDVDFLLEEAPTAIRQTLEGVDRVATIVRAMKAFGHPGSDAKSQADLNDAIGNALIVAANEIRAVADVRTDLAELPLVMCHVGDINQVVLNLLVNAAHAIEAADAGRGEIRVSTRLDGREVVIDVADTGTGVPPEIADKLFDPFFTTKTVGKGTGQGLSLIRNLVVDRHHGSISFTSEPGAGTVFTVRLPVDPRTALASTAAQAEVPV